MPRRQQKRNRNKILPDPLFGSVMVTKIINRSMKDGKKSVIQKQMYDALDLIAQKTKEDPIIVLDRAFDNIRPEMEVRPRRVGGAAYQVPMQVHGTRKDSLAVRWLVAAARGRSNSQFHTFAEKLAVEIIEAANGEGNAVKKRQEVEHVAEANRAFAHFKW